MRTESLVLSALTAALVFTTPASAQLVNKTVDVFGVTREYLVYLPAGYDGSTDFPVLLVYHGGDSTSFGMLQLADFRSMADAQDFIPVYPQGLVDPDDGATIWNSEGPFSNGVDEIGFTSKMIDALDADYAVDTDRVYACGYSNGANMAWELACLLSDRIAAVGPVAGSMWEWTEDMCNPTRPVAVVSIHGTNDFYNGYNGTPPYSLGLIEASEYWVNNNNADTVPTIVDVPNTAPFDGSTVDHYTWGNGDQCVATEHYRVQNGGHDWPGVFGNMDIDSNTIIWEFVSQYSLNGLIGCGPPCSAVKYGVGAGGANIGILNALTDASIGSTLQLNLRFAGAGVGILVLSLQQASLPGFGGTILVDVVSPITVLPVSTASDGTGTAGFPIPADPLLVGLVTYAQSAVTDSAQVDGWALSHGLEITVCN